MPFSCKWCGFIKPGPCGAGYSAPDLGSPPLHVWLAFSINYILMNSFFPGEGAGETSTRRATRLHRLSCGTTPLQAPCATGAKANRILRKKHTSTPYEKKMKDSSNLYESLPEVNAKKKRIPWTLWKFRENTKIFINFKNRTNKTICHCLFLWIRKKVVLLKTI